MQNEKENKIQIEVIQDEKLAPQSQVKSQHVQNYLQMMKLEHLDELLALKNFLLQKLDEKRMLSSQQWYTDRLTFDILSHTSNHQCLLLKVCYGKFNFFITLIMIEGKSPCHQSHLCFYGSFSTVRKVRVFGRQLAIKCNLYKQGTFQEAFQYTLSQYLALLIASSLGYGPNMDKLLGFDLFVYENCVQFSMQFCQRKYDYSEAMEKDLRESLRSFHSLNIIHSDIKPDNIVYSNFNQRFVFIDYGLHQICKQPIGLKTYSSFRGSANFCSPQMKKCFSPKVYQHIDLYFNDAYSLDASLNYTKKYKNNVFDDPLKLVSLDLSAVYSKYAAKGGIFSRWMIFNNQLSLPKRQNLYDLFIPNKVLQQIQNFEEQLAKAFKTNQRSQTAFNSYNIRQQFQHYDDAIQGNYQDFFNKIIKEFRKMVKINCSSRQIINGRRQLSLNQKLSLIYYCRSLDQQDYFKLLNRYLYFFNFAIERNVKQTICCIFNELYIKENAFQTLTIAQKLSICYRYLINFAIKRHSLGNYELEIIKRCLDSLAFLQQLSPQEFKEIMMKICNIQGSILRKIRIFLTIFSSLFWIHQRIRSKYSYFEKLDLVFKFFLEFIESMDQDLLNKKERSLMAYLRLAVKSSIPKNFIQNFGNDLVYKPYLQHALTNDYELLLIQIHQYAFIRALKFEDQQVLHKYEIVNILGWVSAAVYKVAYGYQIQPLLANQSAPYLFQKSLQQYGLNIDELKIGLIIKCKDIFELLNLQKGYAQKFVTINQKENYFSAQNAYHLFVIVRLQMYLYGSLFPNLRNEISRQKFKNIAAEKIMTNFTIQNCLLALTPGLVFHQHIVSQIKSFLTILIELTKLGLIKEQIKDWLKPVYHKILEYGCEKCRHFSLFLFYSYIRLYQLEQFLQLQDNLLTILINAVKRIPSVQLVNFIHTTTQIFQMKIDKMFKDNMPRVSYFLIDFIYQVMWINNYDFSIYFSQIFNKNAASKPVALLGSTMMHLWISNPQKYFHFVDKLYQYINQRFYKYRDLLYYQEVSLQMSTFCRELYYQRQIYEFTKANIDYFQEKLRQQKIGYLALYFYPIVCRLPKGFLVPNIVFVYIWQFLQRYMSNYKKSYLRQYYKYIKLNKLVLPQQKLDFLVKNIWKDWCKQVNSQIKLKLPSIKMYCRRGMDDKLCTQAFKEKIRKFAECSVKFRKNNDLINRR